MKWPMRKKGKKEKKVKAASTSYRKLNRLNSELRGA